MRRSRRSDWLGLHPTSAWNHWVLSCAARVSVLSFLDDAKIRESNHRARAHVLEVAEYGECECTGDRCRCHRKEVWCAHDIIFIFSYKGFALI